MIASHLTMAALIVIAGGRGDSVLTPESMAKHGFSITCRFTNHTITEGTKPTRPTGLLLVQVSFDAEKGPAINKIEWASLVVRDGEAVLLSVPVPYAKANGVNWVQFSIHKDMLPKAQLELSEGGQGSKPGPLRIDLSAFYRAKSADAPGSDEGGADKRPPEKTGKATPSAAPWHCYYLFEAPAKLEGRSDSYIPLLILQGPLERANQAEVFVVITYERDSIWKLRDRPARLDQGAVDSRARTVRLDGKVYRYQQVATEEALRLLRHPLGTLPVHRPHPPITKETEPLHRALLRDLAGPAFGLADGHDDSDPLWILKPGDPNRDRYRHLLKKLEQGKVSTAEQASRAALVYKLKTAGLLAEERADVTGLVRLGIDVADFAKSGDLIWVVRFLHLSGGVTQEMWIASTTGAIRTIFSTQGKLK